MRGRVTAFDEARGLGTITADDGQAYPFHCTQLTDGSRQVDPGQVVRFELLPKLGRYEAGTIDKLGAETA
jgi:CspA family cold shock protein